jgi:energy-converting hydrogenase Eha subunit G
LERLYMQVRTVNSNSRTSNCQCSLFSQNNPIIWIFWISGWFTVPINPDKWSSTVLQPQDNKGLLYLVHIRALVPLIKWTSKNLLTYY